MPLRVEIPRHRLYPIFGFLLALGAPAGLLLLRGLSEGLLLTPGWIASELEARALTYAYVTISTATMFVVLGFVLGSNQDLLQRMSLTDPLTGLANRRHFDKRLREELARCERYSQPLALMFVDVDDLKSINDRKGHEAGDNALRAVSRTLVRCSRATDLAARIGGDEFAVLAPSVTMAEAAIIAERIRSTLTAEASWVAADLPGFALSMGIADTRSVTELHPDRIYAAADRALLQAKQEGKNRVALAPLANEPQPELQQT